MTNIGSSALTAIIHGSVAYFLLTMASANGYTIWLLPGFILFYLCIYMPMNNKFIEFGVDYRMVGILSGIVIAIIITIIGITGLLPIVIEQVFVMIGVCVAVSVAFSLVA